MPVDFTPDRWEAVKETYRHWWAGELPRPILDLVLDGRDPGRPEPKAPILSQATCADLSISVEALIDRLDYELSKSVFLGDSFPMLHMESFGPGVGAAFLGARLDTSTGRVWFHPPAELPIEEIHLSYDPDNIWLRRIKNICAAGMDRWQGRVQIAMTDIGGALDILSTFRPSENLLMDLIDSPDEVKRLIGEIHLLWNRFYAEIDAILHPQSPGYATWCRIFSNQPYYIHQCDFCYMISPDMFREFVHDDLATSSREMPRCFYHLDGRGQLPHLDMILAIDRIAGVQWVPGDGAAPADHWIDVYRRIFAAGKKTQLFGDIEPARKVIDQLGVGPGVHFRMPGGPISEEKKFRQTLTDLGFED